MWRTLVKLGQGGHGKWLCARGNGAAGVGNAGAVCANWGGERAALRRSTPLPTGAAGMQFAAQHGENGAAGMQRVCFVRAGRGRRACKMRRSACGNGGAVGRAMLRGGRKRARRAAGMGSGAGTAVHDRVTVMVTVMAGQGGFVGARRVRCLTGCRACSTVVTREHFGAVSGGLDSQAGTHFFPTSLPRPTRAPHTRNISKPFPVGALCRVVPSGRAMAGAACSPGPASSTRRGGGSRHRSGIAEQCPRPAETVLFCGQLRLY